jgi:hypothetical protein
MKNPFFMILAVLWLSQMTSGVFAADRIGGMRLLPGYKHQPLQGFDSIVGKIEKENGLRINYDIGAIPKPGVPAFGGGFSDRPKLTRKGDVRWYREQVINGQPVHLAHRKDNILMVSYPKQGVNFSVTVRSAAEMADALLMILTYPNPVADVKPKKPAAGR